MDGATLDLLEESTWVDAEGSHVITKVAFDKRDGPGNLGEWFRVGQGELLAGSLDAMDP
jgi:hypothetical protein